jgi:hypothetical protein
MDDMMNNITGLDKISLIDEIGSEDIKQCLHYMNRLDGSKFNDNHIESCYTILEGNNWVAIVKLYTNEDFFYRSLNKILRDRKKDSKSL